MATDSALDFNEDEYQTKVGEVTPDEWGQWHAHSVVGPYDALTLVKMRQLIRPFAKLGREENADVFVLSLGESPERHRTKIGGLPYWRRDRRWPTSEDGEPLPFLAQFNFQQSRDIVGDLPGDILLLFAYPDVHSGVCMEWAQISDSDNLVVRGDIPAPTLVPGWHGHRWRSKCYPEAELMGDEETELELEDGSRVFEVPLLFQFIGTQIGRFPYLSSTTAPLSSGDQILCSLATIWPSMGVPFPFLNHPGRFGDFDVDHNVLAITDYPPGADVCGVLHVIQSANGDFNWRLANA